MAIAPMKLKKTLASWKESFDKPRQCLKKQRHHIADKGPYSQSYGFPGVGDGQGGLACCDPWVRKESDTTEQLN